MVRHLPLLLQVLWLASRKTRWCGPTKEDKHVMLRTTLLCKNSTKGLKWVQKRGMGRKAMNWLTSANKL